MTPSSGPLEQPRRSWLWVLYLWTRGRSPGNMGKQCRQNRPYIFKVRSYPSGLIKSHKGDPKTWPYQRESKPFSSRAGLVEMRCTFTLDALHAWLRLPG